MMYFEYRPIFKSSCNIPHGILQDPNSQLSNLHSQITAEETKHAIRKD